MATLVAGQARLEAGQARLETGQARLKAGQAKLVVGQAELVAGQVKLEGRVGALETGQAELRAGQLTLGNHMRVLHEDALGTIKALDPAPLIAASERRLRTLIAAGHDQVCLRLDLVEKSVGELWKRQASP